MKGNGVPVARVHFELNLGAPGATMSFVFYFAVLLAALVSVIMGLEVATTPPPARTATQAPLVEPIRHPPSLPTASKPPAPAPAVAEQPRAPAPVAEENAPAQTTAQSPRDTSERTCNIAACEARYQSFRASDCTYQPLDGPRRLCRK